MNAKRLQDKIPWWEDDSVTQKRVAMEIVRFYNMRGHFPHVFSKDVFEKKLARHLILYRKAEKENTKMHMWARDIMNKHFPTKKNNI